MGTRTATAGGVRGKRKRQLLRAVMYACIPVFFVALWMTVDILFIGVPGNWTSSMYTQQFEIGLPYLIATVVSFFTAAFCSIMLDPPKSAPARRGR